MMQDNQSGDNRGDLLIHQSLTVPPASLNFAIRLSAHARTAPAPASEAQILLQRSIARTDITTINHR